MTRIQFENLNVGDICTLRTGTDAGRLCNVVYIEDEVILICSADGQPFKSKTCSHGRFRLTNWRELIAGEKTRS